MKLFACFFTLFFCFSAYLKAEELSEKEAIIDQQNQIYFNIYYKNNYLDQLKSYQYNYQSYFDLLKLLQILEIKFTSDPFNKTLEINLENQKITLEEDNNFFYKGDKAFIKADALNFLEMDFRSDLQSHKIYIGDYAPLNRKIALQIRDEKRKAVKEIDEELIAFAAIKIGEFSYDELVDIYEISPKNYYISLNQLAYALDFVFEFEESSVKGWYIRSSNQFLLDLTNKIAQSKEGEFVIDQGDLFKYQGEIFLNKDFIEKILPLRINYKVNAGLLVIKPLELLPFQLQREREIKREKWLKTKKKKEYPLLENKYQAISAPIFDVALSNSYDKQSKENDSNYSINSASDLGYLSQASLIRGNEEELSSARINLKREFENNKAVQKIEFGDVNADALELATSGRFGRGIKISNQKQDLLSAFDNIDIVGNSQPNWEVELYRNNIFINFVETDDTGRYEFRQVPLNYGENTIKLVFYGPQGEIKEETRNYNIDSSILRKNEFNYSFSALEKQTELIDVQNEKSGESLFNFNSLYGLSKNNSLRLNAGYNEFDNSQIPYLGIGLSSLFSQSIWHNYLSFDSQNNDYAFKTSYFDNILNQNIGLEGRYLGENYEAENLSISRKLKYDANFNLNGNFAYFKKKNANYSLQNSYEYYYDHSTIFNSRSRISSYLFGTLFAKDMLFVNNYSKNNGSSESLNLNLSARRKIFDTFFRFDSSFDILPDEDFKTISLSTKRKLYKKFDGNLSLSYNDTSHLRQGSAGIIYDAKAYLLSCDVTADSEDNLSVNLRLSFSLYPNLRNKIRYKTNSAYLSNSGGASLAAFLDENYNNIKDEEEEYINNVRFFESNRIVKAQNKQNYALINNISDGSYSNISIDETSLDDPYYIKGNQGYKIKARRGVVQKVDLPLIESVEIEGTISQEGVPIPAIKLYLIDEKGNVVKETKAEYDGYYLFEKLKPGKYFLSLDETDLEKIGAKYQNYQLIIKPSDETIYQKINLTNLKE